MKIIIILVSLMTLFISGCFSLVKYNTKTGDVSYLRMGDQKLNGVIVEFDPITKKVHIELESQESKGDFGPNVIALYEKMFDFGFKAGQAMK